MSFSRISVLLAASLSGCTVLGTVAENPDGGGDCMFSCEAAGITCGDAVACGVVVHCGPPCQGAGGGTGGGTAGGTGGGGGVLGNPADCTGVMQPMLVTSVPATGTNDYEVLDFLVSSGTVYLARQPSVGGTTGWNTDGRVAHVKANGGTEQPWTQGESWPDILQLVGGNLYYLDASYGRLKRIDLSTGGAPQLVFSNQFSMLPVMNKYVVVGDDLVWANTGSSDTSTASIWRTHLMAGQTDQLASNVDSITYFWADADGIYFITANVTSNMTTLWMIPPGAAGPVDLHDVEGWETMMGLTTDASGVFTIERPSGELVRVDRTSHTVTQIASVGDAVTFVIDGTTAWWTQSVCAVPSPDGCPQMNIEIHKAAFGAASSTVLATIDGWFFPEHMRTEGNCLFWDDRRTRSISRIAK